MIKTDKSQVFIVVIGVMFIVFGLGATFLQSYTRAKRDITNI